MLVWVGYDNNREFQNNYSYIAKNIWANTMEEIQKDASDNWYKKPNDVIGIILDSVTGEVTDDAKHASIYYYLKGSEPNIEDTNLVISSEIDKKEEVSDLLSSQSSENESLIIDDNKTSSI